MSTLTDMLQLIYTLQVENDTLKRSVQELQGKIKTLETEAKRKNRKKRDGDEGNPKGTSSKDEKSSRGD